MPRGIRKEKSPAQRKKENLEKRKKAYKLWALNDGQITYIRLAKETGLTVDELKRYKGHDKWEERYKKAVEQGKYKKKIKEESYKIRNKDEIDDIDKIQDILSHHKLTDREALFAMYYLQDFNLTQSAKNAGYSEKTAHFKGYEVYNRPRVQAAIKDIKSIMYKSINITAHDILEEYIKIAFADITNFVKVEGNKVKIKDTDKIDGRLVTEIKQGRDGISIKLVDKLKALEKLDKLFDVIPDRKLELDKDKFKFAKEVAQKQGTENKVTIINDIR